MDNGTRVALIRCGRFAAMVTHCASHHPSIAQLRRSMVWEMLPCKGEMNATGTPKLPVYNVPKSGLFRRLFLLPDQLYSMPHRTSTLSTILRSPLRILLVVLLVVFTAEVGVMFVLPHVFPEMLNESGKAVVDAILLTLVCAPALWLVIIGPLRRIAIQEHERSETIVANANESILTFNEIGSIVSCNRAAVELFEGDMESLIGSTIDRIIPNLLEKLSDLPCEFRSSALGLKGDTFPVQVSISQYPSEFRDTFIVIIRDLTDLEQAEQQRLTMARETEALRAQQMATLAQLATGVAHEIRNPLTSIKMLIQVNRTKFANEGLPTDDLELVEQEIRRMERSVNSLLDYARPESSEFRPFAIQAPVRRTVQLIEGRCNSQNVKLVVESPETPLFVNGDAAQIQQLLLNLALNAIESMAGGGLLEFTISAQNKSIEVAVADSGSGISDDVLEKLFTPFVTTKPNGVGLGLGICRRIAESHRGTLTGSNRITGGAVFRFTMPAAEASNHSSASDTDHADATNSVELK